MTMSGRKYMDYEVEGIKTKGREGGGMNLNYRDKMLLLAVHVNGED